MQWTRYEKRKVAGFSLIEALIVVALMALVAAFAIPSVTSYRTRAHARSHAERVMGVLQTAREQAISFGQPVLVLFDDPANPSLGDWAPGVFARVIRSTDGDYAIDAGIDIVTDIALEAGLSDRVTTYGQGPELPFATAGVPAEDAGGGTLGALDQGTSFPVEGVTGLRGVAFSPQGMAVAIDAPTAPVSGAFYVTDSLSSVYAVVLRPLGSVGIRTLHPETLQWN